MPDLQEQEETVSTPSTGQSSDWEARYKGQLKEYNRLKAEFDKTQSALVGKEGYAKELQQEKDSLATQLRDIEKERQGEITRLSTELERERTGKQTVEQQLQSLLVEKVKLEREQEVRRALAQGYNDLTPWFDSGYLQPGERTGDELTKFFDGFRTLMGRKADEVVTHTLRGSSPPAVTPGQTNGTLSLDMLDRWLSTHDESDTNYSLYFDQWIEANVANQKK